MAYLGYVISVGYDGVTHVKPDPTHVRALRKWPTPKTASSLRSFLGLAQFLRHLLEDHARIVPPLVSNFHWGKTHKQALIDLKDVL